jgi:GGDEF domain-containing protein
VVGDLPVTVSVGAALAGPGDSQYTLLARADRNLYAAKSGGRNRVVADPPGAAPSLRGIGG